MLDKIKMALRISHSKLDLEIIDTINAARAELLRLGIDKLKVEDEGDHLITEAIKVYCKYAFAVDMKQRDGFFTSWQYQVDCLRKTSGYRGESNV